MGRRWLSIGLLAAVLFVINVVARLVARFGFPDDTEANDRLSLLMFALIGLILAAVVIVRARREPVAEWSGDLAAAVGAAMLLTVLVGPFVSGSRPFADGAGEFFSQIWLYLAFTGGGALLGYLLLTAAGRDHRSQSLKRYVELSSTKPRRVVRR
ncbi:MAG TPA: hypothetical protein VGD43_15890 [Micromonospora sp.]